MCCMCVYVHVCRYVFYLYSKYTLILKRFWDFYNLKYLKQKVWLCLHQYYHKDHQHYFWKSITILLPEISYQLCVITNSLPKICTTKTIYLHRLNLDYSPPPLSPHIIPFFSPSDILYFPTSGLYKVSFTQNVALS